jgi:hypothetical protein
MLASVTGLLVEIVGEKLDAAKQTPAASTSRRSAGIRALHDYGSSRSVSLMFGPWYAAT